MKGMHAGLCGVAALLWSASTLAASVTPQFLEGNINSCAAAGWSGPGVSTNTVPIDGQAYALDDNGNTVTFQFNPPGQDKLIDWSATIPLDLVVIKGGSNANGFYYVPPAMSDTGLFAPDNDSGGPAGVSHAVACFTYRLTVTKTADTAFTRTWPWSIEKSVVPESSAIFNGDSQVFAYTVAVDRGEAVDSDFRVFGDITIANDTPAAATITGVSDSIGGNPADVDCGVTFPHVLAAGASLVCSYDEEVASDAGGTNVATVTTSGAVQGGQGSAPYVFGDPTTVVNASINVSDSNPDVGAPWQFSDDDSVSYDIVRDCGADAGQHDNTATIIETGADDSASAVLACHALAIDTDTNGAFDRRWSWLIDKTENEDDPLVLMPGQTYDVLYGIELTPSSSDEGWNATGGIVIDNPHPSLAATLTQVVGLMSPDIAETVDCPALSVPASGQLTCSYSVDLPDAAARTHTATATQQNHSYAANGTATATGTTDYSDSADLVIAEGNLAEETDECVDVTDLFAIPAFLVDDSTPLGSVCEDGNLSLQFTGTIEVPEEHCGPFDVDNTAAFVTNDTATEGSDAVTIAVEVECNPGCTLTQGYWKTHSAYGPAPYDATWALVVPGQEDTPFFPVPPNYLTPPSWYQVMWTPPQGNAYYNLAHQWIAASLNRLNGASAGEQVQDALLDAELLFKAWTPAQVAALKGNKQPRPQFISLAGVLGMYNEGEGNLGPMHCSEDTRSAR